LNKHHLAQINVAQAVADMESPEMTGFVSRLDEINAMADHAPGFIWRLQGDNGNATSVQVFDDNLLLVNMSVWKSIDALREFVYKSIHVELIQNREAWFSKMVTAHQALWWIPAGHTPTEAEGKSKLEYIREHGTSAEAFTFGRPFTVE
jgi:hypothetical protein